MSEVEKSTIPIHRDSLEMTTKNMFVELKLSRTYPKTLVFVVFRAKNSVFKGFWDEF